MTMTIEPASRPEPGEPQWIERAFNVKPGRDPLGLQTITMDRIMPRLVPSILGLTRRARYFSLYAYLLSEYERLQLEPSNDGLSEFIKAHEYEYALAVLSCPRRCFERVAGAIGSDRATPAIRSGADPLERGESVESRLGGYGLYYRTPMAELGIAARAGEQLGERPTPIDVLSRLPRAAELAESFRTRLRTTEYGAKYLRGITPIPRRVLAGYAERMCLCSLGEAREEQSLLRSVLLGTWDDLPLGETEQRRRSFAYVLHLLDRVPDIAAGESAMRDAIWRSFERERANDTPLGRTAAQWAALIAKDVMQDALSSIWKDLCALGLARQSSDGMTPGELDDMLKTELPGRAPLGVFGKAVDYDAATKTREFAAAVVSATQSQSLESVRRWANNEATAIAGLALLLVLYARLEDVGTPRGWAEIAVQRSERQPSLLELGRELAEHMTSDPTVPEMLSAIAHRSIIMAHQVIAYSKLPDFTFRFRWENERLRFYPYDRGRFEVTDIRRDSILTISRDLGYWDYAGVDGVLSDDGRRFAREALDLP